MATTPETAQDDSSMRLSVSNFGPIAKADIELRPLTVFVGPSNTGKSYLAILLYALHRIFNGSFQDIHASFNRSLPKHRAYSSPFHWRFPYRNRSKSKDYTIIKWAAELSRENTKNEKFYEILPSAVASSVFRELNAVKYPEEEIFAEIARCFGVNAMSEIIRHAAKSASISITKHANYLEEPFEFKFHMSQTSNIFETILPDKNQLRLNKEKYFNWQHTAREIARYADMDDPESAVFATRRILRSTCNNIFAGIVNPFHLESHYFPASRTGVMEASHVIQAALYSRISKAGREPISVPLLSGIIADFLPKMDPDFLSGSRTATLHKHADQIEEAVTEGKVLIENPEYNNTPAFFYQASNTGKAVPLITASSMVTELAPVILYLRYLIHDSDVLIIEEPESHLHPSKQVEFMRQLASLVQKGIRIIITTHSEWVLEAISNIVKVSELPASQRNGLPSEKISLKPNDIGVWLFRPQKNPKGSKIEEIKINDNSIDLPDDYYEVMLSLYNEHVEADNRMNETSVS